MTEEPTDRPGPLARATAHLDRPWPWVSLVLLAVAWTYGPTLDHGFAAADTFPLIESARIQAPGDIWRILTEPLMAGTDFPDNRAFYRPVSTLTYSLDHGLWGLEPTGYHLTNLVLHGTACLLVLWFGARLTRDDWPVAGTAALLFALHPVGLDVVPGLPRRQDTIATVGLLAALLAFDRHLDAEEGSRRWQVLAGLGLILAMGGKEIAVVGLPLIPLYAVLFWPDRTPGPVARLLRSWRAWVPVVAIAAAWIAWRAVIVGGTGGHDSSPVAKWTDGWLEARLTIISLFGQHLFHPFLILAESQGLDPVPMAAIQAATLVVLLGVILVFVWRSPRDLTGLVEGWTGSRRGRIALLMLGWLATALALFLVTTHLSARSMYSAVVPFAVLVASGLVGAYRTTRTTFGGHRQAQGAKVPPPAGLGILGLVPLGLLALGLVLAGPLIGGTEAWRAQGEYNGQILAQLPGALDQIPEGTAVGIKGSAGSFEVYETRWPRPMHTGSLATYSLTSWFQLTGYDREVGPLALDKDRFDTPPGSVTLRVTDQQDSGYRVIQAVHGDG